MSTTPVFPLSFGEYELYESTDDIIKVTRFHIKNIVLTNPGEKISDANFGVGIKKYLFENFTQNTNSDIRYQISSQINRYAPHVDLLSVDIVATEDYNVLKIRLSYYIPVINESDILSFSISNTTAIW